MNVYRTIESRSEGIYKEKGSRFLSFAIPVCDLNDVQETLLHFKKEYADARHICYAYTLGNKGDETRANDNGEPSGTAGKPILGQIKSNDLTNVLVLVVRYFGGVLLGTGGLVKAYKLAAAEALNKSTIIEKSINIEISIQFDYLQMNSVMKIIKEYNIRILNQNFDSNNKMILEIQQQLIENVKENFHKINGLVISI